MSQFEFDYERYQKHELQKIVMELDHPVEHRRKSAQQQIERLDRDFHEKAQVDAEGVVRWKSNHQVPPTDILGVWQHLGKPFNLERSLDVQEAQNRAFSEAYRRNYKGPSEEARCEARAAFGPGVKLVNVITGHEWTT